MTGRNLHQEWVGKTSLAEIPPSVKRRILDSQRPEPNALPICPCCGRPIRVDVTPEYDHRKPLADGGEHRETNLRAIHPRCHKRKTAKEAHERALARAAQMSAYGIDRRGPKMRGAGFRKAPGQHTATRPIIRKSERREQP